MTKAKLVEDLNAIALRVHQLEHRLFLVIEATGVAIELTEYGERAVKRT